jgi:uncharacterized membrane protein
MNSSVGHVPRANSPSPRRQSGERTKATETPGAAGARVVDQKGPPDDLVTMTVTTGVVAAGAALLEVALFPSLAFGAAIALAPRLASGTLPWLCRQVESRRRFPAPPITAEAPATNRTEVEVLPIASRLGVERALAKTVTYRIIVTGLDFTWNFIILGEVATAAGLSGISIVGGPLFYFMHEATWNYLGSSAKRDGASRRREDGSPSIMIVPAKAKTPLTQRSVFKIGEFKVGRALAKTIVYRTLATTIEFTTNYVVVRDIGEATALSAFGFVIGPFVYLGHEVLWDRLWPTTRKVAPEQ